MNDHLTRLADLEQLASRLPGVRGAKVELGPGGAVTALRLLIVPERDAESTRQQIRDLASSRLGIDLDPSVIHVLRATLGGEPRPRRRKLTSLVTERAEEMFRARVTLELPGDVLVGESQTPPGEMFERRAVATAVVEGLSDLLDFSVAVESVELIQHGGGAVVLVTLHRADDRLVGTAGVRHDVHDAVARATLDALNRFLGINLDRLPTV